MEAPFAFRPKLFETLRDYSRADFGADCVAGLTVGIVALPLAMAFAIASGVKPEAGIFTAVIGGFLISALGGSRIAIGGPTGAFIVILYGIHAKYGAGNLAICTAMAGVMLLIMGLARMGTLIKFIPYPVTMGFTSGIAVLIRGPGAGGRGRRVLWPAGRDHRLTLRRHPANPACAGISRAGMADDS